MRRPRTANTLVMMLALACAGTAIGAAVLQEAPESRESPAPSEPPPGVEATVDQLAFISGDWQLPMGDDLLDEQWSEPSGDCLMGSFRWMKKDGLVWMYEFLTMRNEADGVTMRFRHFDSELTAWEEKSEPISLRLTELAERRAVFEHFGGDGDPWTMVFHRVDDDGLTITLVSAGEEESAGQAFAYRRPDDS